MTLAVGYVDHPANIHGGHDLLSHLDSLSSQNVQLTGMCSPKLRSAKFPSSSLAILTELSGISGDVKPNPLVAKFKFHSGSRRGNNSYTSAYGSLGWVHAEVQRRLGIELYRCVSSSTIALGVLISYIVYFTGKPPGTLSSKKSSC